MAKILRIEPETSGYVRIIDEKRPEGVTICSDGVRDLVNYLGNTVHPRIRELYHKMLQDEIPKLNKYLIKLALDNTKEGIEPTTLIETIWSAYRESWKKTKIC